MSSAPVLVIAPPREAALWEDALRARGLDPIPAGVKNAREEALRRSPAVVLVSEKLPLTGPLRVIRELRRDPATREAPVVLAGVPPLTTSQRLRLGAGAPDATVARNAGPQEVAEAVAEAMRRGKLPAAELTASQQAWLRYGRLGTLLMIAGVLLGMRIRRPEEGIDPAWFVLLIPLGGLWSDVATGRVDGRKKLLSWQGWAAIVLVVLLALGNVFLPRTFRFW